MQKLTIVWVICVSLPACAERSTSTPMDPNAAPSALTSATIARDASDAGKSDPCAVRWQADRVHGLQAYPSIRFADIAKRAPSDGLFTTEANVTGGAHCPPCPPKALCKPCPDLYVNLQDEGASPIYVEIPIGIEMPTGQRFRVSLATCASSSPRYQLRGMEPVPKK